MSRLLILTILTAGLIVLAASINLAGDPPKKPAAEPARPDGVNRFLKLTPAERARLLKTLDKDKDFQAVDRGPVTFTIVERGSLEADQSSDVICRVRGAGKKNPAIIKWLIDDGTTVKKGDKLIEFDDADHAELLRKQKAVVAKAEQEQKQAAENLARTKKENQLDVKVAQIDVRLAQLAVVQYKGQDAVQKEVLSVHVDRAGLLVERIKLKAVVKENEADADLKAKEAVRKKHLARQREIEKDIASCVVAAPQDGLVVYVIPEGARFSSSNQGTLALREPMREGQKLMVISDLKHMSVNTAIKEAVISKVRKGQKAEVRVDAFPNRSFTGKVHEVATTGTLAGERGPEYKVYKVMISVDGENDRLKPGMSGEVTIAVDEQPKCLRVPATAVLERGKDLYCVVAGNDLELRKVTVGLTGNTFIEIRDGLKEGERVLRNPPAVVRRLD